MILLGLGANLPSLAGPPQATLERALEELAARGARTVQRSPWYGARPVPASEQPDYVNGVAQLETALPAGELLAVLHQVERQFGRFRQGLQREPNAARPIDLDLLAYGGLVVCEPGIKVPHPRLHLRSFVLAPLCDIAPQWIHPALKRSARQLYQALGQDAGIWRLAAG